MRGWTILIIALVGVIAVGFIAWSRMPDILANDLSSGLGVPVSIDSMSFAPKRIDIRKLSIGNPKGYSLPKAFSAEEIKFKAPVTTYLTSNVVVDEVDVNDIYLGIEFDTTSGTKGNWTVIFKHYQDDAKLNEKDGKKVLIKKLICNNIRTELLFKTDGAVKKLPTIKRIVLTNISTEGGVPTDQLMSSILGQMLKEVFIQQNLNDMIKGLLKDPKKAVDTFLKPFEGIFNTAPRDANLEYVNIA